MPRHTLVLDVGYVSEHIVVDVEALEVVVRPRNAEAKTDQAAKQGIAQLVESSFRALVVGRDSSRAGTCQGTKVMLTAGFEPTTF